MRHFKSGELVESNYPHWRGDAWYPYVIDTISRQYTSTGWAVTLLAVAKDGELSCVKSYGEDALFSTGWIRKCVPRQ